jgi:transcriptional regulator with XRE-family HTH domain
MSTVPTKPSIGPMIKARVESVGMSKAEMARRLSMSPANIHKIFKRRSVDIELLQKISEVLTYDFISHYRYLTTNSIPGNVIMSLSEFDPQVVYTQDAFRKIRLIIKVCNNLTMGNPARSVSQFVEELEMIQDILNDVKASIHFEKPKDEANAQATLPRQIHR